MALNIKPLYPKDHPDVTNPTKGVEKTGGHENEERKDYRLPADTKEQDPDKIKEKLKDKKKKSKISPMEILRRLNIIK